MTTGPIHDERDDEAEYRSVDGLLLRVAEGDRGALAALFESEAGRMIAVARRILRRRELAEEAVQDAFVAIWQRATQFDPARGPARSWMTTIARNRALNMLRDGGRMQYHGEDELESLAGDAERSFDLLPERESLRRCLAQLDPERRSAILLAYVSGFSHVEIATRMKTPLGTIKAWIRRGTVSLQECLS